MNYISREDFIKEYKFDKNVYENLFNFMTIFKAYNFSEEVLAEAINSLDKDLYKNMVMLNLRNFDFNVTAIKISILENNLSTEVKLSIVSYVRQVIEVNLDSVLKTINEAEIHGSAIIHGFMAYNRQPISKKDKKILEDNMNKFKFEEYYVL